MKIRYPFLLKYRLPYCLSVVFLVFFSLNLQAQTAPAKRWDKSFGGDGFDYFSALQQTSDGGFILGGYSNSGNNGTKTKASKGEHDYWILKLDAAGNKTWDKTLGGNMSDFLESLQQTSDGGYILVGSSQSGISGDKSQACLGVNDYWVVKLDLNGNKVWDKTFGGLSYDNCRFVQQTSDSGYILGGTSDSGIGGDKSQASQGKEDYWILKLDASGNKIWDKTFGGSNKDQLWALQQTTDGGYILGGISESGLNGNKSQASKGNEDYWVIKLDAGGNKVWDKTFGGSNADRLTALQQTLDGGFMLGGESFSGISGDKSQPSKGQSDYWFVKLDASGNKLWDKTIGGSGFDAVSALQQTADGGFITGGWSSSGIGGDKSEACQGIFDYWVVKLDAAGNISWEKTFGGTQEDQLCSLQQTANGGFVLGGYSGSGLSGNKSQVSFGTFDYWIIELAAPCSALSATLAATCKNGNSAVNLNVMGIQSGASGSPSWTLTYTVDGVKKTVTGTSSASELTHNAAPSSVYALETMVSGSCTANLSNSLIIPGLPEAPKAVLENNCGASSVTLSAAGAPVGGNYVWYNVASGGTPLYASPSGTFVTPNITSSATFYVAASNNAGCEGARTAIAAIVPCPPVVIPNIVTPNNDTKNDFFIPQNLPEGKWRLQIYDRWGIKVFEAEDYQSNWPASKIAAGTYFYYLKHSETGQQFKGWVEVVH